MLRNSSIVIYDACVLYPFNLRDFLMHIATTQDLIQAKWTDIILDECFRSILRNRPDLNEEKLKRTRQLMCAAVPDCIVLGFEELIEGILLPDPDDRHVVAAALKAEAKTIVTFNLSDFPPSKLEPLNLRAIHPDEFVLNLLRLDQLSVLDAYINHESSHRVPTKSRLQVLEGLRNIGMVKSANQIEQLLAEDDLLKLDHR